MALRRKRLIAQGQVQGVGFRPYVFTLAEDRALTGFVRNSPRGVVIEIQGAEEAVAGFSGVLRAHLPPLARITSLEEEELAPVPGEGSFAIAQSTAGSAHAVLISPDTAVCGDCLADMADKGNRRYRYPFTNCTNCGPRYTITRSIPYDRASTSMACFPLCPDCRAEYENPRDRRFHAQPNACPVCGPSVWLTFAGSSRPQLTGDAALRTLADVLLDGGIAAVKGLGGFHLACDACNDSAVTLLRKRKHRPHKPFAVMAASLEETRRFARIGDAETALLTSREQPIVLCPALPDGGLSSFVSPDTGAIGVMLPYTPLHRVLLDHVSARLREKGARRPAALVMTSGNPGGEPICLGNREALAGLSAMADAFLFHNRDILIRVDDSVTRPVPGLGTLYYRRARGYVPRPVRLAEYGESAEPCVLGVGPELKNTLCLTKNADAFVSQHIGDMGNLETAAFHREIREHLADLLKVAPDLIVRDLHPEYLVSHMAEEMGREQHLPVLSLQHHFAHAHAVLAEHRFKGKALVVALDGTGLGHDGALWGGEFLFVDTEGPEGPSHERLAHIAPMPLPGGEAAIREPWRIAHGLLLQLGLATGEADSLLPWLPEHAAAAKLLPQVLARGVNCPVSTGCGRLFDAAAALMGLCAVTSYEGQAAVRLEEAQYGPEPFVADAARDAAYPCPDVAQEGGGPRVLDTHALFRALYADVLRKTPLPVMARRFHHGLAAGVTHLAASLAEARGLRHVGLSGGCLQNATLATLLVQGLAARGLTPLTHRELPPGDACISLGQAAWGRLMAHTLPHPPRRNR